MPCDDDELVDRIVEIVGTHFTGFFSVNNLAYHYEREYGVDGISRKKLYDTLEDLVNKGLFIKKMKNTTKPKPQYRWFHRHDRSRDQEPPEAFLR